MIIVEATGVSALRRLDIGRSMARHFEEGQPSPRLPLPSSPFLSSLLPTPLPPVSSFSLPSSSHPLPTLPLPPPTSARKFRKLYKLLCGVWGRASATKYF